MTKSLMEINKNPIQRNLIRRDAKPLNKYNTSLHMEVECMCDGASNDRTGYDCGMEPEPHNLD